MTGRVQFILIAGAMALLSQLSLTVNSSIYATSDVSYENEAVLAATSIAQSILREAAAKNFDEKSIGKKVTSTDSLTAVCSLGPETGEVYPAFDDVDDYKGYVGTRATDRLGSFNVSVDVRYTNKGTFGAVSSTRTFMKLITVTVSGNPYLTTHENPSIHHDVVMQTVVSY